MDTFPIYDAKELAHNGECPCFIYHIALSEGVGLYVVVKFICPNYTITMFFDRTYF